MAILGVEDPRKLAHKIWASFSIPEVRMRAFLEQGYTVPPCPQMPWQKCLPSRWIIIPGCTAATYSPNSHLCQGLQYWVEELNLLESPDLCPLAGSVVELRETLWEHVTFTNGDVLQGLGTVYPEVTNQWPQATLFSRVLSPLVTEQDFTEATIHTTSPAVTDVDTARCTTPPFGTEGESWYLLVITASVEQLSLGSSSNNPERSTTDLPRGNTFQNPWMAAIFSESTRAVSYGGATIKELKEWDG